MNNQDPISLKDLPEHLKSKKDTGCVVDMGMIMPEKKKSWLIPSIAACLILIATIGITTYNYAMPQEIIVAVTLDNNEINSLSNIISNIDKNAKVITVTKKENGTHELKISTRKSKKLFLDSFNSR
jgi:K+/H+ antiporter YhaU regulatory subunit KhtT